MAVARQTGFPVIAPTSTATQSVTVNAGTDRLLVVYVAMEVAGNTVSGITHGGVALTKLGHFAATTWSRAELWYLIAPATGTADVVLSRTGTGAYRYVVDVFDGADQTTALRSAAGAGADSGTSSSHTVTGFATGDLGIDLLSLDGTGHTPAPDTGQTATIATQNMGAGTNELRTSEDTANGTLGWTWTTSAPNSHIATAIIVAGGTAHTLATTIAAVSTVTPSLAASHPLAATVAGASTVSPTLAATLVLAAAIAGASTVTVQMITANILAATISGVSTASPMLTVTGDGSFTSYIYLPLMGVG